MCLLKELSKSLSIDIGKNVDERELCRIRQFYLTFPIRDTVRPELSWLHYRFKTFTDQKSTFFEDV